MNIIKTTSLLQRFIHECKQTGGTIGFVPTMGAIHEGHLFLLKQSIVDNDYTVCSIYVNPKQFNNKQDLINYPRDSNNDISKLQTINCDAVFLPSDSEIYKSNDSVLEYNFTDCFHILEGKKRPGHFLGVVTIVHKLFNIVQPDKAYFGEKDYQQLWIIKLFQKTYKLSTQIISCLTIRDDQGLALSSRNKHLTIEEKKAALNLFKSLKKLKIAIESHETNNSIQFLKTKELIKLKEIALENIMHNSLIKLDYFEIIESENFRFMDCIDYNKNYRALIAVCIGKTRLIDNISIN